MKTNKGHKRPEGRVRVKTNGSLENSSLLVVRSINMYKSLKLRVNF